MKAIPLAVPSATFTLESQSNGVLPAPLFPIVCSDITVQLGKDNIGQV